MSKWRRALIESSPSLRDLSWIVERPSTRAKAVARSVAGGAGIVGIAIAIPLQSGVLSAVAGAVLLTAVAPTFGFVITLMWGMLCRPGMELFHFRLFGLNATEIDLVTPVAFVAVLLMNGGLRPRSRWDRWIIATILAWPLFYALRFMLPAFGATEFASRLVDLRNVLNYAVLIPILLFVGKKGWRASLQLLTSVAYLASAIALTAWTLLMLGVVGQGKTAVAYFYAINDVRPGAELTIVITVVLLAAGVAPLPFRSRVLAWILLVGELLVSQTLSIVLAVICGVVVLLALNWRSSRASRAVMIGGGVAILAVILLSALPDSRFNLIARLGGGSAGYRFNEMAVILNVLLSDPLAMVFGAGPGSRIDVQNIYSHRVDFKRDAHDVYAAVALKTGLIGLLAFLAPFALITIRLLQRANRVNRALAAALVAVVIVSFTVPFIWTAPGVTSLMLLFAIATSRVSAAAHHRPSAVDGAER